MPHAIPQTHTAFYPHRKKCMQQQKMANSATALTMTNLAKFRQIAKRMQIS